MKNNIKEKMIKEFSDMKILEESARDFYTKISLDPEVEDEEVRKIFRHVAKDEENHTKIVQKIINMINNNL